MKLLFIGDIMGEPGRKKIVSELPAIMKKENIGFVIAQGENLAAGIGITEKTALEIYGAGVDCITTGNHIWKHKEIYRFLDLEKRLLRPANYPEGVPGKGYAVYEKGGTKIGVVNLQGRVFMRPIDDPFRIGKKIIDELSAETPSIFVDFHAEATSEKRALGLYLSANCAFSGFVGTHTHIQTADEQIINNQTAYLTDVGMVGARDSIIGDEKDDIITHYLLQMPQKFKVAKENIIANCVIIDFDEKTGRARSIVRHNF